MNIDTGNYQTNGFYQKPNVYKPIKETQKNNVDNIDIIQPDWSHLTVSDLTDILKALHKGRKENSKSFENQYREKIWNDATKKIYEPEEKVLSDFLEVLKKNDCSEILDEYNVHVFFELATYLKISWLFEKCKKVILNPSKDQTPLEKYIGWKDIK